MCMSKWIETKYTSANDPSFAAVTNTSKRVASSGPVMGLPVNVVAAINYITYDYNNSMSTIFLLWLEPAFKSFY